MKYLVPWICGVLLIGVATFEVVKRATPPLIMSIAMKRLSQEEASNINKFLHADQVTAEDRRVVRPSPELAYSTCVYDLSAGDVAITLPRSDEYLSLAFYDAGTNNYYILNSDKIEEATKTIILSTSPSSADNTIQSPTAKGIALVRRIVRDERDWLVIAEERSKMKCEAL